MDLNKYGSKKIYKTDDKKIILIGLMDLVKILNFSGK